MLRTFGRVRLGDGSFTRPKPLLLLVYLTVTGPCPRRRLAELFWPHAPEEDDAARRKALSKLSVAMTQCRREGASGVFPDVPGLDPLESLLESDVVAFEAALAAGEPERALEHYRGPFLADLGTPLDALGVAPELHDWVLVTRERLAERARAALLDLAETRLAAGDTAAARELAERAEGLAAAPEPDAAELGRLQRLLARAGSDVAEGVRASAAALLDELPEDARRVYLALTLLPRPDLALIRAALGLGLSAFDAARETLILQGLMSAESEANAPELARAWLEQRPTERMPLLLALGRTAPPEDAFAFYRDVYRISRGFGGRGDLPRARRAYHTEAEARLDTLDYAGAAEILSELRAFERTLDAAPDSRGRFLEAVALERLGRYQEGLERTEALPAADADPDVRAIASVLLWRVGRPGEAHRAAEDATGADSRWLWARATGHNTLGYLATGAGELQDAASHFRKAASLYQATGDTRRRAGSLNNVGIALDLQAREAERSGSGAARVATLREDAERTYRAALATLPEGGVSALRARIGYNLGVLAERRGELDEAELRYRQSATVAEEARALDIAARLLSGLGYLLVAQGRREEARENYRRCIELAAAAGEVTFRGVAMASLAELEDDPDAMEVALELIEESGDLDQLATTRGDYARLLERILERSLLRGDAAEARHLLQRLGELYRREHRDEAVAQVGEALDALHSSDDPADATAPLMALLANVSGRDGDRDEEVERETDPP